MSVLVLHSTISFSSCKQPASTCNCVATMKTVTSRMIHVRGVDFRVEISNPNAPNVILCLPGALGTAQSHFGPQLETGFGGGGGENLFYCVSMDPRGLGGSRSAGPRDFPPDYYERDAADAAAVMKELGYQNYIVLGWSDGACAALKLASHPTLGEAVLKLVIWGGNAYFTEEEVENLKVQLDVSKWTTDMVDFFVPAVGGVSELERHNELLMKSIQSCLSDRGGIILTDKELSCISCPTLVLHGAKDELCDTKHAKYLAEHIPKASLIVFPDAGHDLHLTLTKEFDKVVREFLEREE